MKQINKSIIIIKRKNILSYQDIKMCAYFMSYKKNWNIQNFKALKKVCIRILKTNGQTKLNRTKSNRLTNDKWIQWMNIPNDKLYIYILIRMKYFLLSAYLERLKSWKTSIITTTTTTTTTTATTTTTTTVTACAVSATQILSYKHCWQILNGNVLFCWKCFEEKKNTYSIHLSYVNNAVLYMAG